MAKKLTEAWVKSLPEPEVDAIHWDTELRGFGLRVRPSGRRSWVVQYRTQRGVHRKTTLGTWPVVDAAEARRKAKALLGALADGRDPVGEEALLQQKPTIADLAERYKVEHAQVKNKPSTAAEVDRVLKKQIVPAWGNLPVDAVTSDDVARLHHKLRQTPRGANHAIAVASKMFSLAERWKLRPQNSNPCRGLDRYRENKRVRFPSEKELEAIGAAIGALTCQKAFTPQVGLAVRLLALTGLRRGELLALRWSDVDLAQSVLTIRDAKAGPREHVVGAAVADILREADQTTAFVVPGFSPDAPLRPEVLQKGWGRIREAAGCPDLRLHDLRHGFGTYAAQTGANAFLIRDSLGHKTLAMTGRYVNRDANPLRDLTDQVARRVGAALTRHETAVAEADQLVFDFAAQGGSP